jgi:hypothetical protein
MRVIQDDLWLCTECLCPAVNGDYSSLDYYYDAKESAEHKRTIDDGLDALGPNLVSDYDCETGEGIDEFSHHGCDCCGTDLAGTFYRFAILGD